MARFSLSRIVYRISIALAALSCFPAQAQDLNQNDLLVGPAAVVLQQATPEDQAIAAGNDVPPQPAPPPPPSPAQTADYAENEESKVFGARLFTGAFSAQSPTRFNPDYAIAVGDNVQVRMWGAFNFQSVLTVDPQGNIFLPNVGPVNLVGVSNGQLQQVVEQEVGSTFRSNVYVYASLAAAQPVRVYVGGYVNRPGSYAGTSLDSVLHYLDQAGGIDPARGSFLDITVRRGEQVRAQINLYDFLLSGSIPQVQLAEGDVIFVNPRKNVVEVNGLVENANVFEFSDNNISMSELQRLARPNPNVTNVRVRRSAGETRDVDYYSVLDASRIVAMDGDIVTFTADQRPGTITVRVEGEHESPQEYVLPYGARLGDVLSQVVYTERSAPQQVSLFRESVKLRQKEMLDTSLDTLEQIALTARSGTREEAQLRATEADLLLQWVDRARDIEPRGQVVIAQSAAREDLLLEDGDVLHVPAQNGLVIVSGEVLFPNALAYDPSLDVGDYIARAGGFSSKASNTRIIVGRPDGSFGQASRNSQRIDFGIVQAPLAPGDEILVLPKVDSKNRQIFKEVTQILYQIAVSAGVVLGL